MRKSITLFLGLVLFIAVGVFFFLSQKKEEVGTPESVTFRLLLNKAHIVGRYNGKLQWELVADKTEKSSDERFTYLYGIKNGVFYEWEKGKLHFEAEKAIYDNITKKLQLERVNVWNKNLKAQAPLLVWDGEKGLIVCEKGADFQMGKASLKGDYIEVNLRDSYMLVNNGILKARLEERL